MIVEDIKGGREMGLDVCRRQTIRRKELEILEPFQFL